MIRSYLRVLPDLYARKALGVSDGKHDAYPPEAVVAYLGCLCLAEAQTPRGRFASRKVLAALLEGPDETGTPYAATVGYLIDNGDLIVQDDGSVYVEGWNELQEGDWKVSDRMRRFRERRNPQPAPADVADDSDPAVAYMQIVGTFPRGKVITWIDDLTRQFGADATLRAICNAATSGTEGLLGRAADALRMEARRAETREKQEEAERLREKRSKGGLRTNMDPKLLAEMRAAGMAS